MALPNRQESYAAFAALSPKRRRLVGGLAIAGGLFLLAAIFILNEQHLVTVRAYGGSLTEGVIGAPRFINPVLASSDADRDVAALVYSGLMRPGADGVLIPDLAQNYEVSDDGLTYTFTLKDNLVWPDGSPITADDIAFTVARAQDPLIKSPRRASWDGVRVETDGAKVVHFVLKQPYISFLENTTMGILPSHIWKNITADEFPFSPLNIKGIGSGPYQVKSISQNNIGLPAAYTLEAYSHFALGRPAIQTITLHFYPNAEDRLAAYNRGEVEAVDAADPIFAQGLGTSATIITAPLPRTFGVFFNQNHLKLFTDHAVRQALSDSVDRQALVQTVLHGYGTPLSGPIPPGSIGYHDDSANATATSTDRITTAKALLAKNGWAAGADGVLIKKDKKETTTLAFTITTANVPELQAAATELKKVWTKLGAKVTIEALDPGDLNQNLIRPRKYDALLFGEILGRDPDPFSFWHSSQRLDPGLNIAMYTNADVDKLLEKARQTSDVNERITAYQKFEAAVQADDPAVFLYAPAFVYVLPNRLQGVSLPPITTPAERFATIYQWYDATDRVWPWFASK